MNFLKRSFCLDFFFFFSFFAFFFHVWVLSPCLTYRIWSTLYLRSRHGSLIPSESSLRFFGIRSINFFHPFDPSKIWHSSAFLGTSKCRSSVEGVIVEGIFVLFQEETENREQLLFLVEGRDHTDVCDKRFVVPLHVRFTFTFSDRGHTQKITGGSQFKFCWNDHIYMTFLFYWIIKRITNSFIWQKRYTDISHFYFYKYIYACILLIDWEIFCTNII